MKTRIAVLVSGGGTNLQALIDARDRGELPDGELVLVISNKENAYALERARNASIPTEVCRWGRGLERSGFEAGLIALLEQYRAELIVMAGFMVVLSPDFINRYPERIINVHPSLIPSFCGDGYYGLRVHRAALAYGVKVTGATVHFVNEITDGGRIIAQKAVDVLPTDTPETLQRRVMEQAEWVLLPRAVQMVARQIRQEAEQ